MHWEAGRRGPQAAGLSIQQVCLCADCDHYVSLVMRRWDALGYAKQELSVHDKATLAHGLIFLCACLACRLML